MIFTNTGKKTSKDMFVVIVENEKLVWRVKDVSLLEDLYKRNIIKEYSNLKYTSAPGDIINYL